MENIELDIKTEKYWNDELSYDDKVKLLAENNFWDGLKNYHYGYIPEDLKVILRLKIEDNDPQRA
jgi:hypothetical protein